jgi:hypothetical protein
MKRIHEASASSATTASGRPLKNSTQITGYVTASSVKGVDKFNANLMTHSYDVVVMSASTSSKSEPGVRKLSNGFRLLRPAQVKASNALVTIYEKILADFSKNKEWAAKVINEGRDRDFVRLDLDVGPFKTWSVLDIQENQRLRFDVTVSLSEPLIKAGNIIEAKSFQAKLWGRPSKASIPAAPVPPAAAAAGEAPATEAPNTIEEVPHYEEGVPDFLAGQEKILTAFFGAEQVTLAAACDLSEMSPAYILQTLMPICSQKLGNERVIVLPLTDAVLEDEAAKEGLVVGLNTPTFYESKTGETSGPRAAQTYAVGNPKRALLPINIPITEYVRVSKEDTARTTTLAEQFPMVHEDAEHFPNEVIFSRVERITGKIYATHASKSGFADATNFSHVSAYKNIPCTVLVRLSDSRVSDDEKKASVIHVEWHTKEFLLQNSFPISNDFAWTILGRKATTGGITSFGMDSNFDKTKTWAIRNESNELRGNVDLLLVNEADVPVAPYLDPSKGWQARLMMVPNQDEFAKKQDAQKVAILGVVTRANAIKTPEEGEAFVREYVAKYPEDMTLESFGHNTSRHRVFVWFYKPDEGIYKNDMPVYLKLRGDEPPAKKQKTDAAEKKI